MAQTGLFPNVWGVFDQNGVAVLDVDTIVGIHYSNETKTSNFPVEQGAFTTYNKVATPFEIGAKITVGGDHQRIANFLNKLEQLKNDTTNLYHFATPEVTYLNATIKKFSYSREAAKGQNMVTAMVELMEVREVIPSYTSVLVPLAASRVKKVDVATMSCHGKQQTQPPPAPNYGSMSWSQLQALARQNVTK